LFVEQIFQCSFIHSNILILKRMMIESTGLRSGFLGVNTHED
jgi:hypothetical protein